MREFHVLNHGAGVQTTTLFLLVRNQEVDFKFDVCIFGDTKRERKATYDHLAWMQGLEHPRIWIRSIGDLGADLLGTSGKKRFASIPAFTGLNRRDGGVARRQCSREYKSDVVERAIRRELLNLKLGQRIPKDIIIHRYFGITRDEAVRSIAIKKRLEEDGYGHFIPHFPLMEMGWTRSDCDRYNAIHCPHEVPRSSCVFCPYHDDEEWYRIKARAWSDDPSGQSEWRDVVRMDYALRDPKTLARRGLREPLYLHPARKPIDTIDFRAQRRFPGFVRECAGVCGV